MARRIQTCRTAIRKIVSPMPRIRSPYSCTTATEIAAIACEPIGDTRLQAKMGGESARFR